MTRAQSAAMCAALGVNPTDPVGDDPREIALLRVFDEDAADQANDDDQKAANAPKPQAPARGHQTKTPAK